MMIHDKNFLAQRWNTFHICEKGSSCRDAAVINQSNVYIFHFKGNMLNIKVNTSMRKFVHVRL